MQFAKLRTRDSTDMSAKVTLREFLALKRLADKVGKPRITQDMVDSLRFLGEYRLQNRLVFHVLTMGGGYWPEPTHPLTFYQRRLCFRTRRSLLVSNACA